MTHPNETAVDVRERGANQQTLDRRLFMQLQAFGGCADPKPLAAALEASGAEAGSTRTSTTRGAWRCWR